MKLIVRYSDKKIEILQNNSPFVKDNRIPDVFVEYIKHISNISCETIQFKWHCNHFYNIALKQIHNEFHFDIKKIEAKKDHDTDQILAQIANKYLSEDEKEVLDSSDHQIILSIFLEIKKMKLELESSNKFILQRLEKNEENTDSIKKEVSDEIKELKEEINETMSTKFLEKDDFKLAHLIKRASKSEFLLLIVIILTFISIVDTVDVKRIIRQYLDDPVNLID